jgi:outer membrane protein assembly factor BamB
MSSRIERLGRWLVILPGAAAALAVLAWTMPLCAATVDEAAQILSATGIKGGLVVHLGCGDGTLTAALRANDSYLVQGLDARAENVEKARAHIRRLGLYGTVSVEQWSGGRLPYVDNLVNLIVAEGSLKVARDEMLRALAPGGVAYLSEGGKWTKIVKPWPKEIDQWTHALHGPDNNAVAQDSVVGPPRHLQWVGGPRWARSHDHLASMSVVVSSGGRLFDIHDEGPIAAIALPSKWVLAARDAFSGVVLWQRPIEDWEGRLRGFRTGPAAIARKLVAIGDEVYVTLGYGQPVSALDAATGQTLRTYAGTDGVLLLVIGDGQAHAAEASITQSGPYVSGGKKRLLAVRADSGAVLWQKADAQTSELLPTALAVAGGRVFFENPQEVVCLDAQNGQENWRAPRPVTMNRWAWSSPTLVAYGDVVFSADRDASSHVTVSADRKPSSHLAEPPNAQDKVVWVVHSLGGEAPKGELIAFSAKSGQRLWSTPCQEGYNSPVDVLVAGGLVWTGSIVSAQAPGITEGRDPLNGEVKRTRPSDLTFFTPGMGHHRCYRNKATEQYLVVGRGGTEFVDVATGKAVPNHWVRGVCQYGIVPCNGLLYAPPNACACFIEAKLNGFNALAPAREERRGARDEGAVSPALQRGPAYGLSATGEADKRLSRNDDWPTYRCDAARSGRASSAVPTALKPAWRAKVGDRLSSPVVAGGKVFVADIDAHTVCALDAFTGKPAWSYTAGGRVDSPPTVVGDLALFGSADGWVYCLQIADGKLVWRFRAAPTDQRLVAYGQVESVWPVPGNVLVHGDSAYCVAGRSSFIDGGMHLYRLDLRTGKVLAHANLDNRDPATGEEHRDQVKGTYLPGVLPDILSCDGSSIYLRHMRFDLEGNEQKDAVPHLFSPAGFLDDTWWHRTYWILGTQMISDWGGWPIAGRIVPAGRLMVLDESSVYSFGRLNQYARHGAHVGLPVDLLPWPLPPEGTTYETTQYRLFACSKSPAIIQLASGKPVEEAPAANKGSDKGDDKKAGKKAAASKRPKLDESTGLQCQWSEGIDLWARAMVLAGKTLFVAGPPDALAGPRPDVAAYEGRKGGLLWAVATADGKKVAAYPLDSPPVMDGMAAAGGRLYLSSQDGQVLCMGGSE